MQGFGDLHSRHEKPLKAVHSVKTIPFPEKPFDLGRGMPTEKEQRVGYKKFHLVALFNDGSKGINAVTHVGVTANKIDTCEGSEICIFKHGAPP